MLDYCLVGSCNCSHQTVFRVRFFCILYMFCVFVINSEGMEQNQVSFSYRDVSQRPFYS